MGLLEQPSISKRDAAGAIPGGYCTGGVGVGTGVTGARGSGWRVGWVGSTHMILIMMATKTAMNRMPNRRGRIAMPGIFLLSCCCAALWRTLGPPFVHFETSAYFFR
ncbi:hypothetical protein EV128_121134 [Rhizobium azibense]|nr:hypothetical protein EV128_121134 [Rhizobium azibense]